MASFYIKSSVLGIVCWKYAHYSLGCSTKASRQDKRELPIEERLMGHENKTANQSKYSKTKNKSKLS